MSEKQEADALETLQELGLISRIKGKYVPHSYNVDTRHDRKLMAGILTYWFQFCCRMLSKAKGEALETSVIGYRSFSLSHDAYLELRKATFDFFNRVNMIVEEDKKEKDHLLILNLALVSPREMSRLNDK